MMYFEESLSEGKETDVVTVINLPAVVAADYGMTEKYEEFSFFINDEMEEAGEELFINLRVKEFLFQGYESKFLHGLAQYSSDVYDILPDAMFGVFYGQNNSVIKNITVFTGVDNKNLLGKIYALGGKRFGKHPPSTVTPNNKEMGTDAASKDTTWPFLPSANK